MLQHYDSENLQDDDIRESLTVKHHLQKQGTKPSIAVAAINCENNNNVETGDNAMETPQLSSDISSFNPDDPQVRQIDIDTSSLSSSANNDVHGTKQNSGSS